MRHHFNDSYYEYGLAPGRSRSFSSSAEIFVCIVVQSISVYKKELRRWKETIEERASVMWPLHYTWETICLSLASQNPADISVWRQQPCQHVFCVWWLSWELYTQRQRIPTTRVTQTLSSLMSRLPFPIEQIDIKFNSSIDKISLQEDILCFCWLMAEECKSSISSFWTGNFFDLTDELNFGGLQTPAVNYRLVSYCTKH